MSGLGVDQMTTQEEALPGTPSDPTTPPSTDESEKVTLHLRQLQKLRVVGVWAASFASFALLVFVLWTASKWHHDLPGPGNKAVSVDFASTDLAYAIAYIVGSTFFLLTLLWLVGKLAALAERLAHDVQPAPSGSTGKGGDSDAMPHEVLLKLPEAVAKAVGEAVSRLRT